LSLIVARNRATHLKGEETMYNRLLNKLKHTAAIPLLISAFVVVSAPAARAEAIFLFRSPEATLHDSAGIPRAIQQKSLLKLDEKGDLLIQCGSARFTVAYNSPADQFKPAEQPSNPQREYIANINGISLTASLSF
jgi:hypothetical protein